MRSRTWVAAAVFSSARDAAWNPLGQLYEGYPRRLRLAIHSLGEVGGELSRSDASD